MSNTETVEFAQLVTVRHEVEIIELMAQKGHSSITAVGLYAYGKGKFPVSSAASEGASCSKVQREGMRKHVFYVKA